MGLGSGGAVVSRVEAIAMHETATGAAVLFVSADASGRVITARVLRASGDQRGWRRIASQLEGVTLPRLRIHPGARRAWLTLSIEAAPQTLTGEPHRGAFFFPGALGFDATDLADAPRLRVVHARVLSEVWL
jgi:hypothetical protein